MRLRASSIYTSLFALLFVKQLLGVNVYLHALSALLLCGLMMQAGMRITRMTRWALLFAFVLALINLLSWSVEGVISSLYIIMIVLVSGNARLRANVNFQGVFYFLAALLFIELAALMSGFVEVLRFRSIINLSGEEMARFPRLVGFSGGSNFSAVAMVLVFYLTRRYTWSNMLILAGSVIILGSRTAIVLAILLFALSFMKEYVRFYVMAALLAGAMVIVPLTLVFLPVEDVATSQLNLLSTNRLFFSKLHADYGWGHWVGMGHGSSTEELVGDEAQYRDSFRFEEIKEAHSLFIQFLADYGVLPFALFVSFLFGVYAKSKEKILCVSTIVAFSTLNGLTLFPFWFGVLAAGEKGDYPAGRGAAQVGASARAFSRTRSQRAGVESSWKPVERTRLL